MNLLCEVAPATPETQIEENIETFHPYIRLWHKRIAAGTYSSFLGMLKSVFIKMKPLQVGTACSGTDICIPVFEALKDFWREDHELEAEVAHVFAAELDVDKRRFLLNQNPNVGHMFGDINGLASLRSWCYKEGELVVVPTCNIFIAGFSCKSRSPNNRNSSEYKHCLQEQTTCETQDTWEACFRYIQGALPPIVIMENVKELTEKSAEGSSDADFVVSQLQAKGYFAMYSILEALDYGSLARRKRIWFIAVLRNPTLATSDAVIESLAVSLLTSMAASREQPRDPLTAISQQRYGGRSCKTTAKADPITALYKDDHLNIFNDHKMAWPPNITTCEAIVDAAQWSRRQGEVVFFLNERFPPADGVVFDFCDVNLSLPRLLAWPGSCRNPWSTCCPTLTGSAEVSLPAHHLRVLVSQPIDWLAIESDSLSQSINQSVKCNSISQSANHLT